MSSAHHSSNPGAWTELAGVAWRWMRWMPRIGFAFVLAASVGCAFAQAALPLNNAGFEGPYTAPTECANVTGAVATGWSDNTCWDSAKPTILYASDAASPHGGSASQRITLVSGERVQFAQYLSQPLEVLRSYTASVWLRSAAPMTVTLQLRQTEAPYQVYAGTAVSVGAAWTRYQFEGVVSGGNAVLLVVANEPGTFWIDDAAIDAGATVPLWGAVPADAVPVTYFGMHFNQLDTPWPQVGNAIGSVRIWDAGGRADGSGTSAQWAGINPAPGRYDWSGLDARVAAARAQGADIVYTLGGVTPRWASSKPDAYSPYGPGQCAAPASDALWKAWVKAVVGRYRGAIRYWELWNEPDLSFFYCSSPEQLVRLAQLARQVAREVDPQAVILSPGMSGYGGTGLLEQFLNNGGAKQVDTIAFHFYADKPEDAALRTLNVRRLMERSGQAAKPLWNTEQGWIDTDGVTPRFDPQTGAAYVARALLVNWALGHKRFYWYTWDNRYQLIDMAQADRITLTPAGTAYREVAGWMTGRVMESLQRDSAGNFIVTLRDPAGARQRVLWNPDATVAFSPPVDWAVTRRRDVAGVATSMVGVGSLQVGSSPLILDGVAVVR